MIPILISNLINLNVSNVLSSAKPSISNGVVLENNAYLNNIKFTNITDTQILDLQSISVQSLNCFNLATDTLSVVFEPTATNGVHNVSLDVIATSNSTPL